MSEVGGAASDSSEAEHLVHDPVARFAHHLPFRVRCTDDLDAGVGWAPRGVALLQREIAPDPEGWRTSLRFDVDCPCERQVHAKAGYCDRAATYWEHAALAQPSFVVVNPGNGHAHYVYLLRGWLRVDGRDVAQLQAVRYYGAIERAYTRALRADPGYASFVHHNPLSHRYTTLRGRGEPYSLRELASYVTLTAAPRWREPEIRNDGRNVETFDRLRYWAYRVIGEWRCGSYGAWAELVSARAVLIAAEVREQHPGASHPFSDREVAAIAKSVAGWVWLRYDGANPITALARAAARRAQDRDRATRTRRERGSVPRDVYLAEAQRRRVAAARLRDMGLAIDEIARRLSASLRSVHRWIAELRSLPSPSQLSDFKPRSSQRKNSNLLSRVVCEDETPDLLVYARQRLSRSTRQATQNELFGLRGDRDAAEANRPREEAARGMGPRTARIYDTVVSRIQRRISEIRSGTSRRGPP